LNRHRALSLVSQLPIMVFGVVILSASLGVKGVDADAGSNPYVPEGVNANILAVNSGFNLPLITANYSLRHAELQRNITQSRVAIGEQGFRIDQLGEGAKSSVVFNSHLDKMWLLDRDKKIFHEIFLQVKTTENSGYTSLVNNVDDVNSDVSAEYFLPFLQLEPCLDMHSERVEELDATASNIQVWVCRYNNKFVEKQWFDVSRGVVVKSESFDGMVATLTDIRNTPKDYLIFYPPGDYRSATLEDMFLISQPLNKYSGDETLFVGSDRSHKNMTESTNAINDRYTVK